MIWVYIKYLFLTDLPNRSKKLSRALSYPYFLYFFPPSMWDCFDIWKFQTSINAILLTWLGIIIWLICLGPILLNDLYTVICVTNDMMAVAMDETVKRYILHPFNSGVKTFKSVRLYLRVMFVILVDDLQVYLNQTYVFFCQLTQNMTNGYTSWVCDESLMNASLEQLLNCIKFLSAVNVLSIYSSH